MFSDKRYIVFLLSSETSCLCPYKESEIPENDTSHFRVPYNLYSDGESTSTDSQLTSPVSQKSKNLNKVSLLLQYLGLHNVSVILLFVM